MTASRALAIAFFVGFLLAASASSCGPATSTGCDAESCPHGCCDAQDQCQTSNSIFQCGQGGVACVACGATQQCIIGVCTGNSSGTGGSSGATGGGSGTAGGGTGVTCSDICAGCCDEQGLCQGGSSTEACGASGVTCAACGSMGGLSSSSDRAF